MGKKEMLVSAIENGTVIDISLQKRPIKSLIY